MKADKNTLETLKRAIRTKLFGTKFFHRQPIWDVRLFYQATTKDKKYVDAYLYHSSINYWHKIRFSISLDYKEDSIVLFKDTYERLSREYVELFCQIKEFQDVCDKFCDRFYKTKPGNVNTGYIYRSKRTGFSHEAYYLIKRLQENIAKIEKAVL